MKMSGKRQILTAGKVSDSTVVRKEEKQTEIASLLDLNKSVVSRVINHYKQCSSVENQPRKGRPPI